MQSEIGDLEYEDSFVELYNIGAITREEVCLVTYDRLVHKLNNIIEIINSSDELSELYKNKKKDYVDFLVK